MRLDQLMHILEIARHQSISKAAEVLHISQPALSASLISLEKELGQTIFKRTNRGIVLSGTGKRIHDEAVEVLSIINGWYSESASDSITGDIHIASTPVISRWISSNLIVPFHKLYEGLTVFVHAAQDFDMIGLLQSTSSSIAVSTLSPNSTLLEDTRRLGWMSVKLFTDERKLYLGADHPLAKKPVLTKEDLKTMPLAWYSASKDQISRRYAPWFKRSFRMATREDILDLVTRGEAAFIQPCYLFQQDWRVQQNLLAIRDIPIEEVDTRVDVYGFRLNEISRKEQLFWDYLVMGFGWICKE